MLKTNCSYQRIKMHTETFTVNWRDVYGGWYSIIIDGSNQDLTKTIHARIANLVDRVKW